MISRESINEVREKTDLVALVESKGISLRRVGGRYLGLCPVHSERSPSFNVNQDSQTYHCFGCGIHGNAFMFLQEVDGFTFVGAVEYLADEAGVVIENTEGEDPDYLRKKDYIRCVGQAAWFYRRQFASLPETHPAKMNLANRDYLEVKDRETWLEDFGMGYAPDSFNMLSNFLLKQEFTVEQIVDAGLAFISEKTGKLIDRFRNRLMWEIRDIQGRPLGFSGRRLNEEDNPKYLNTSQTIMYNKSKVLYGLDLAKKKMSQDKVCFVVEGAADVMAVAATGATNTVASCGTAFGSEHAAVIRRIIDDFDSKKSGKFVFVFDGDAAGVKAAMRVFDISPSIRDRSYVVPIENGDPCDLRLEKGDDYLYDQLMNNQVPITEFMINHAVKGHNMKDVEGRQAFANEAMQIISSISEMALHESYKRKISFLSGIPIDLLSGNKASSQPIDEQHYESHESIQREAKLSTEEKIERELLATLLQFPVESFEALKKYPNVSALISNQSYSTILFDAQIMIEFYVEHGEQVSMKAGDFNDEETATLLFHTPLSVTSERAGSSVERMVKTLSRLHKKKHNENVKAEFAQKISEGDDLALLAEMVKKQRK